MTAAIVEGLAGVQDRGTAFSRARIAPRWPAAGTNTAKVSVGYPASQGYVRYNYECDRASGRIAMDFTGSAEQFDVELLLKPGKMIRRAILDGNEIKVETRTIESSRYAVIVAEGFAAHQLMLEFA